jgi:two-component system CheB/CheR fusion protein
MPYQVGEGEAMAPRKSSGKNKPASSDSGRKFPVVCVGASAGGLDAFNRFLEHLPASTGMAFVVIQHLDPSHPSALPPLLARNPLFPSPRPATASG